MEHIVNRPDRLAARLRLDGSYPVHGREQEYHVQHVPLGFGLMLGAGTLSGLLGIGSGAVKVLAMYQAMCLPFKVSTTTSNFMIGVTAAASAGIYLARGYIDPGLAMPVMLDVLGGATLGTRVLVQSRPRVLRMVFAVVIAGLGGGDALQWRDRPHINRDPITRWSSCSPGCSRWGSSWPR